MVVVVVVSSSSSSSLSIISPLILVSLSLLSSLYALGGPAVGGAEVHLDLEDLRCRQFIYHKISGGSSSGSSSSIIIMIVVIITT